MLLPRVILLLLFAVSWAGAEEDNDFGMTRPLGIEEAWVENAGYAGASWENNARAGHQASVFGEADFAFNSRLGGELDFPLFLMQQPLGRGASALGPVALGLRGALYESGDEKTPGAGVVSVEAESSTWPSAFRSSAFDGLGSNFVSEALGGWRLGRDFIQGIYGYSKGLSRGLGDGWFANTSLGRQLTPHWVFQIEGDAGGSLPTDENPGSSVSGTLIPQVACKGSGWMLEVGEGFPTKKGASAQTLFLFEWDF